MSNDRWSRQRSAYENRWGFSEVDMPDFDELSPEEQASVCERCGVFVDSEMPINDGDSVLCGGDVCDNESELEADT